MLIQQVNGTINKSLRKGSRPVFHTQIAISTIDGLESFFVKLIHFAFDPLQANLDLRVVDSIGEDGQTLEFN